MLMKISNKLKVLSTKQNRSINIVENPNIIIEKNVTIYGIIIHTSISTQYFMFYKIKK